MSKKILLSGVKPTGRAHIGNYFGAMKQFVDHSALVDSFECFIMIADYHALNLIQDAKTMREVTYELALDYLALGLDPQKVTIFKQSDISAHTELTWIFDTLVTVPYLERAHAFKDAEAKSKEINVGTFNYPVLMAADILLYNTDTVPVGQDQKQHIEYARDIAQKFNNTFGEVFKLPEPVILETLATVPGTDGRKMSKSYNNTIPLFASREEIEKAVMGIVTDSGSDIPTNVYSIHKLFKSEADLKPLYETNKGKYKILKETLIEDIDAFVAPLREKRAELAKESGLVERVLAQGAVKANERAQAKLIQVKKAIGVL
ncbi:MAG: tryptophan--tRNA ligase [Patescibacteria group bacterium]